MSVEGPKTTSVNVDGEPDGFEAPLAWYTELATSGATRLVVSTPPGALRAVHMALLGILKAPLKVLYRQSVDRLDPQPQGSPPRDFVGLDLDLARVQSAVDAAATLIWHDGRHQLWVAGRLGAQVVLDEDGVIYCYPDDPAFRDTLTAAGVPHVHAARTMAEVDYPKRWYRAENDAVEKRFIGGLRLAEVAHRKS